MFYLILLMNIGIVLFSFCSNLHVCVTREGQLARSTLLLILSRAMMKTVFLQRNAKNFCLGTFILFCTVPRATFNRRTSLGSCVFFFLFCKFNISRVFPALEGLLGIRKFRVLGIKVFPSDNRNTYERRNCAIEDAFS